MGLLNTGAAPAVIGVALSGDEYSWEPPATATEWKYLAEKGVTLVRQAHAWEKNQPTLNGPLNLTQVNAEIASMKLAARSGIDVIFDLHNYMRYDRKWPKECVATLNGGLTSIKRCNAGGQSSSQVPPGALANVWGQLAAKLVGTPGLAGYDLMNEPNTLLGGSEFWCSEAQSAIDAIRKIDHGTTIYVEGYNWASATGWSRNNPCFPLADPNNNLIYEAHTYWDNGSGRFTGTYRSYCPIPCPSRGKDLISGPGDFVPWLAAHNAKGFLGEFGVPGDSRDSDASWQLVLSTFLEYILSKDISGTYWAYAYDEPPGANPWWADSINSPDFAGGVLLGARGSNWDTLQRFKDNRLQTHNQ